MRISTFFKFLQQNLKYWLESAPYLKRDELLETMTPLINATTNLIAKEDLIKIFKTIVEVSQWWP
jgi:hypothetical protein